MGKDAEMRMCNAPFVCERSTKQRVESSIYPGAPTLSKQCLVAQPCVAASWAASSFV